MDIHRHRPGLFITRSTWCRVYEDEGAGMTVYVVSSGEYENYRVNAVAVSVEAAVRWIKAAYQPPFLVEWDQLVLPRRDDDRWLLTGHFESVIGFSTKHDAIWDIEAHKVVEAPE